MTGIRSVVFDLDGTLVEFGLDYAPIRQEAIEFIGHVHGIPKGIVSSEVSIFGMLDKITTYLNGKENFETVIRNLRNELSKIANKHEMNAARTTKLIRGAKEILQEIRSHQFKMGLFTTSGKVAMNLILERFYLQEFFDACVARDDAPKVKPNPSHLNHVLEILGSSPSQALVVGDATIDILCAKAAGVRSIGVLTGVHKLDQLEAAGANYVINTLQELPPLILKMNNENS